MIGSLTLKCGIYLHFSSLCWIPVATFLEQCLLCSGVTEIQVSVDTYWWTQDGKYPLCLAFLKVSYLHVSAIFSTVFETKQLQSNSNWAYVCLKRPECSRITITAKKSKKTTSPTQNLDRDQQTLSHFAESLVRLKGKLDFFHCS